MEDVRRGIGVDELLDVVIEWKVETATPEMCPRESPETKFACRANSVDLGYTCTRNREMKRENVAPTGRESCWSEPKWTFHTRHIRTADGRQGGSV